MLFAAVAGFFAMTSCKKCVECTDCPTGVTFTEGNEICEDDFDSKDDYDAAVSVIEAFGCTCN